MRDKSRGIHILLYGPPGTGKTTLARELARRLGAELFEVRKEFQGGFISDGELRLSHYNLGQQLGGLASSLSCRGLKLETAMDLWLVDLHRNLSQKHYMFASEIEPAVAV